MLTAIRWRGLADPRLHSAKEIQWSDLPLWLAELADGVKSKKGARCYSLVTLHDAAAGRSRANTALVHAVSLDFDSVPPPWDELESYSYIAYTTPSHTVAAPRWRVHIRVAAPVPAADYAALVRRVISDLGSPDVDIAASCDPARLWFSPLEDSDLRAGRGGQTAEQSVEPRASEDDADAEPPQGAAPIETDWPIEAVADHVAEVWGDGVRHPMARAVGGYLARRGWTDDAILEVIARQESSEPGKRQAYAIAAAERARAGQQAPGWEQLVELFGAVWADGLAGLARHPEEPEDWHMSGVPWSAWWARALPRLDAAVANGRVRARETRETEAPRLVVFGKKWWPRNDAGGYHSCVDRVNLLTRLNNLGWDTRDANGKALPLNYICDNWGTAAEGVEHCFGADGGTTWDHTRRVLRVGYALPAVEPVRDADVAAWLAALFGPELDAAHQWIAACAPRYIEQTLTACMVLVGAGNTGKTALFTALASMWGAPSYVGMRDVCAQFNGPSVLCPIVLDDECAWIQQGQMSSQEFLERIQQWSRPVELKGQEKQTLVGAQRVALTANNVGSVRFRNVRGLASLDAAGDRMAWHASIDADAARAALARLRTGTDYRIDLDRVRGHLAWIWANVVVQPARFVGACGREGAEQALQADAADRYGEVYAAVREAAQGGKVWGDAVKVGTGDHIGTVLVYPPKLQAVLESRHGGRISLAMVRAALEAYCVSKKVRARNGGANGSGLSNFWAIDLHRMPE